MSDVSAESWEKRWADGSYTSRPDASDFLDQWLARIPAGRALDVAAGTGRNARLMARRDFAVCAVEVSPSAVAQGRDLDAAEGLTIDWEVADLTDWDPGIACWDLITVIRYRDAKLWPRLLRSLAPGGWIVVEHHLKTSLSDVGGPREPAFRLDPGELLEAFAPLRVVLYEETVEPADHGPDPTTFVSARFVAVNGSPGW